MPESWVQSPALVVRLQVAETELEPGCARLPGWGGEGGAAAADREGPSPGAAPRAGRQDHLSSFWTRGPAPVLTPPLRPLLAARSAFSVC